MDDLKLLEKVVSEMRFKVGMENFFSNLDTENYVTIAEALEKQIPKAKLETIKDYDNSVFLKCNKCDGEFIICDGTFNYCPRCGQRLIGWCDTHE